MSVSPHPAALRSGMPCIGVFDSGLGGLSVLRALCATLPGTRWIYVADSGHAPYGERSEAYVMDRCQRITAFLRAQGATAMVLACNTATAVAIDTLRAEHPGLPWIGIEPGIKPALQLSLKRRIGVMATETTLRSARFQALVTRWQGDAQVVCVPCPGLAQAIEGGELNAPAVRALVERYAGALRAQDVDAVVLGCTHYPWVASAIQDTLGPDARLIDTAQAVADQAARVIARLRGDERLDAPTPRVRACTSGSCETLLRFARRCLPELDWLVEPLPV